MIINPVPKRANIVIILIMILGTCNIAVAVDDIKHLLEDESVNAQDGADIFLKYCAGCHGFDGLAEYELAPSFSMGDRLQKSDWELLQSVMQGKHGMPYWQDKLGVDEFRSAITYLRVMAERHSSGLPPREKPIPEMHYKFIPLGEDEDYWENRE